MTHPSPEAVPVDPAPFVVAEAISSFLAWMDTGNRDAVSRWDAEIIYAHVAALTTQLEAERAEKAQWVEALKDPAAVRLNILRGGIAKPEWRSMLDLYDEKLEQWDRLMEAVNYISQHDNSGLTDGSGATRQCIDRLVEIARNAVDGKFEADLTTRLSSETARADKAEAEAKAMREQKEDAISTLDAWFDRRKLAHEQIDQAVLDATKGYLRRSRVGGMSQKQSDAVEAVIADMVRLSVFADLFARATLAQPADGGK